MNGGYGCGPCALSVITGESPSRIINGILVDRLKHPRPRGVELRSGWKTNEDEIYLSEVRRYLLQKMGWKIRFKWYDSSITLEEFKFPDGVFLVQTHEYDDGHLQVVMRGRIWSTRSSGDLVAYDTYRGMKVDCVAKLPIAPYGEKLKIKTQLTERYYCNCSLCRSYRESQT